LYSPALLADKIGLVRDLTWSAVHGSGGANYGRRYAHSIPGGQTVPTPKNQSGHEHSVAMMHAPSPLQQAPYSRVGFHSHGAGTPLPLQSSQ
jgi:hypothetical protein